MPFDPSSANKWVTRCKGRKQRGQWQPFLWPSPANSLAKNAGTSVNQIERFCAKRLPISKELMENLQSFMAAAAVRMFIPA
jgi:hypothetical protein